MFSIRVEFSTGTRRVSLHVSVSSVRREHLLLLTGFAGLVAAGLSEKHRASQECEAIDHCWWEVAPKCHMVGSGPMCWGREEVTGCSCGKKTCYKTADSNKRNDGGGPWTQGRFSRKRFAGGPAGRPGWGTGPDDLEAPRG